jgi:sulfhydrogenase subunit beta (sulfur reductase)
MPDHSPRTISYVSIAKENLQVIFDALRETGYTLVGPREKEGAIVHDEIEQLRDLPVGLTDKQEPGAYRLVPRDDRSLFRYAVGPHSWKRYLFVPVLPLFSIERQTDGFSALSSTENTPRYAFIGVRPCDLHAMGIQDLTFLDGPHQDSDYKLRRQSAFILAVNCLDPGGTCFCASMHTGPRASSGFDLALTELDEIFLVEVGSELGWQVIADADWRPAGAFELQEARQALAEAEGRMGRQMITSDMPNLLYQNLDHPRWDQVARRCLSCANCTQVCPTCFCSDVVDRSDLDGKRAERVRLWDSCFSLEFSHVHGGNIRPSTRDRYRQWLTHKLASWIDQFGMSGCVGCGRCITWCPAGIDLTEEVDAIRTGG